MYLVLLGICGLVVGSFLGAFTFRYPRGRSTVLGRSSCPRCGAKIRWFDNIPIVSYLLLEGRCRSCRKKISPRYPLIEGATALGFIGIGALSFQNWLTISYLLLVFSVLVAIFVIDLEHKIIPDSISFFLFGLALSYSLLINDSGDFYTRVFLGFAAALFLLAIHLATAGRGMGLGDVKLALFGGAFLSWPGTLVWLFLAFLTGGIVGLILILAGKAKLGREIAFGPYLALSLMVAYFFGGQLFKWLFL